MKIIGYVRVYKGSVLGAMGARADVERTALGDEAVCAVVADLDIEQAVEQAARWKYDDARESLARTAYIRPEWDGYPEVHEAFRDSVRPIVLAALGTAA